MRTLQDVIVATFVVLGATSVLIAADKTLTQGKTTPSNTQTTAMLPAQQAENENGVREETPNQRRHRLGQEITASYPAPDYGETLETPNHRRGRLGRPIVASYEDGGK